MKRIVNLRRFVLVTASTLKEEIKVPSKGCVVGVDWSLAMSGTPITFGGSFAILSRSSDFNALFSPPSSAVAFSNVASTFAFITGAGIATSGVAKYSQCAECFEAGESIWLHVNCGLAGVSVNVDVIIQLQVE